MDYTKIGIACFAPHPLNNLESWVDSAIRKEGRFWGSGQVHIRRSDPNIAGVEEQFRRTKFAGLAWKDDLKSVLESVEYLIVIGNAKYIKIMRSKVRKYVNVKRVKFISI